ncbi:hypothetical protein V2J09_020447 [Rumex salicifolius]
MASFQAVLLGSILFFAMAVGYTSGAWCVCKAGSDAVLQKTLDYACGHGADCNPIKSTGSCYNPNSIQSHCSYAVNSYYQKMSSTGATCDFSGTAYLSSSDPSVSGCSYPASASSAGTSGTTPTSTTPTGTTPVSGTTPISGTPSTSSPYTSTPTSGATPSTGVLGGVGTGLAPTGMGMDDNKAGMVKLDFTTVVLSSVMAGFMVHLWN